ncbi:hypothetical protein ACHAXT_002442 [Thalassiosira profunda]
MGFTTSAGDTESVESSWPPSTDGFLEYDDLSTGRFLKSCSDAAIISSLSLRNFSRFFSSALDPNSVGPSNTKRDSNVFVLSLLTFSRASSSSFSENGFSFIRLKMPVKTSSGRSPPSAMPLLLRRNDSIVIRRSGLMLGLWRSVLSTVRGQSKEKPKMNAVSGEGKTSSFCRVNLSANFSMMRSICAGEGRKTVSCIRT